MQILFLASWYPNVNDPTNGNFIEKHAEAIALKHQVAVVHFVPSTKNPEIRIIVTKKSENLLEYAINYPKVGSKIPIFSQLAKLNRQRKGLKLFLNENKSNFDLVHLNVCLPYGIWALWLKKKLNLPLIITEHSSIYHRKNHRFSFLDKLTTKRLLKKASIVTSVSQDLAKHLVHFEKIKEIKVISNVVNENRFNLGKEKTNYDFIHISNAVEEAKNILGILRVLSRLQTAGKKVKLLIISDGDTKYLQEFREKYQLENSLDIEGTKSTDEVASAISASKALVLFSNYENFPCVIPEAWMSGKPVIASSVNGIPEHLNASNGILVKPGNEQELENAFVDMLESNLDFNPEKIRQYAMKHFSYNAVSEQFDAVYQQIVK